MGVRACYRLRCDKCGQPLGFLFKGKDIDLTIKCHRCGFVTHFVLATVQLQECGRPVQQDSRSEEPHAALRAYPARMAGN